MVIAKDRDNRFAVGRVVWIWQTQEFRQQRVHFLLKHHFAVRNGGRFCHTQCDALIHLGGDACATHAHLVNHLKNGVFDVDILHTCWHSVDRPVVAAQLRKVETNLFHFWFQLLEYDILRGG